MVAAVIAAALSGCAREDGGGSEYSRGAVDAAKEGARASIGAAEGDLASPVVRGGVNGLEVVWFVALDETQSDAERAAASDAPGASGSGVTVCAIGRALEPYLDQPLPISEATRERLSRNGLRMVRVPVADVETILSGVRVIGPRQREWMGWALEWREAFRGRSLTEGSAVMIEGERSTLPECALRLIARCWTAPGQVGMTGAASAVVRVEALGQALRRSRGGEAEFEAPRPSLDARADGALLMSLAWEAALEPGSAYVLVPEAPSVTWREGATLQTVDAADADGLFPAHDAGPRRGVGGASLGPVSIGPPTLGEAMLMNLSRQEHEAAARAVIVLIPRAAQRSGEAWEAQAGPMPGEPGAPTREPTGAEAAPVVIGEPGGASTAETRTKVEPGRVRGTP